MNLNPAPFNEENTEYIVQKKDRKIKGIHKGNNNSNIQNRTIKRRRDVKNMKVNTFLESMKNQDTDDSDNESDELSYLHSQQGNQSLPKPELFSKKNQNIVNYDTNYNPDIFSNSDLGNVTNLSNKNKNINVDNQDNDITVNQYKNISTQNANYKEYFDNFVPYFKNTSNPQEIHGSKDVLLEKINYMIHLLEDQQDEKTGHVTEELILYSFLGVFVIFVVDSFVKVGKYVR